MPTINRVIRNLFTDNGGTIDVTESEYAALLRERREIEQRAGAMEGCEDVDAALADAARLYDLCMMLGDSSAAKAAQERRGRLEHERKMQAQRSAEAEREYRRRLAACLEAAESVGRAYSDLESLVMQPGDVHGDGRPSLTRADLDGAAIVAREGSERLALAECEALAARCATALEAFERSRPRGLADRLRAMLEAVGPAPSRTRRRRATIWRPSRRRGGAAPRPHARRISKRTRPRG